MTYRNVKAERHGLGHRPEYRIWQNIIRRCREKTHKSYPHYGARGVDICQRWFLSFTSFLTDMGPIPGPMYTIDRLDVNGNYEKGNCVWASRYEQANSTRRNTFITHGGKTMTIAQWARYLNVNPRTISTRLNRGWSTERALFQPHKSVKQAKRGTAKKQKARNQKKQNARQKMKGV